MKINRKLIERAAGEMAANALERMQDEADIVFASYAKLGSANVQEYAKVKDICHELYHEEAGEMDPEVNSFLYMEALRQIIFHAEYLENHYGLEKEK